MSSIAALLKPEYFQQPKLLLKRISPIRSSIDREFIRVRLPWRMSIRIRPSEEIGKSLRRLGIIDLPVTEALWRLVDPGEVAIDVGANIGYMTSLLANRIKSGSVWSFEANPEVFEELRFNISEWEKLFFGTSFHVMQVAISEKRGVLQLQVPNAFVTNRGLSFVLDGCSDASTCGRKRSFPIKSISLDELFPYPVEIGVAKIDVEGHESKVLLGAKKLLWERRIRDIVFEEHRSYPTDVCELLEQAGYRIFRIGRTFWGPVLLPPDSVIPRSTWEPTSFLATLQVERAIARLKKKGWYALQRRKSRVQ